MVASKGTEDLPVVGESGLGPRDHGAADARLGGHQSHRPYLNRLPDPGVLDPTLALEVDQDVGAESARIPRTTWVMTGGGAQRHSGQQQNRGGVDVPDPLLTELTCVLGPPARPCFRPLADAG